MQNEYLGNLIVPLITHSERLIYNSHSSANIDGNIHFENGNVHGVLYSQLKYSRKKNNPELGWGIETQDLIDRWQMQKGRCALSNILMTYAKDGGGKKEFNVSIDRISPHVGYTPGNIQLVCYRVNLMKHTLPEEELYWWCKNIVTNKENI